MGTNFYAKRQVTDDTLQSMKRIVDIILQPVTNDVRLLNVEVLKELCDKTLETTSIHLGERSSGWQFLWDHNDGKFYDLSLKGIHKFVKEECGNVVYDEYGDVYSWEDFIKEEVGCCIYQGNKYWNGEAYNRWILSDDADKIHKTEPMRRMARKYLNEPKKIITIRDKEYESYCHDFTTKDGLRFASSTDFS